MKHEYLDADTRFCKETGLSGAWQVWILYGRLEKGPARPIVTVDAKITRI